MVIFKFKPQSVLPHQHSKGKENQQRRHADFCSHLGHKKGHENQNGRYQKQVF